MSATYLPMPRLFRVLCGLGIGLLLFAAANAEPLRVLTPHTMLDQLADVAATHANLELVPYESAADIFANIATCDAIIGEPDETTVAAAPRLRWIQTRYTGMEWAPWLKNYAANGLVVTNTKIVMGPQLADHAFALLLSITRNMRVYLNGMERGSWNRFDGLPLLELNGKTMLIIGLGGAGIPIAERAAAFNMRVIGLDHKDVPYTKAVDVTARPDELMRYLPEADVVVSAVPLTDQSRHMLGADQFAVMKQGAIVINVSRGGVIDTNALTNALKSGRLAGAGLDVTEPEPLPANHPLWTLPNVVITPHIAGFSDGRDPRIIALVRDNLSRFARGLPLKNSVNLDAGY